MTMGEIKAEKYDCAICRKQMYDIKYKVCPGCWLNATTFHATVERVRDKMQQDIDAVAHHLKPPFTNFRVWMRRHVHTLTAALTAALDAAPRGDGATADYLTTEWRKGIQFAISKIRIGDNGRICDNCKHGLGEDDGRIYCEVNMADGDDGTRYIFDEPACDNFVGDDEWQNGWDLIATHLAENPPPAPVGIDPAKVSALLHKYRPSCRLRYELDSYSKIEENIRADLTALIEAAPSRPMVALSVVEKLKADIDDAYHKIKTGTYSDPLKKLAMFAWDAFDKALAPHRSPAPQADEQEPMVAVRKPLRKFAEEMEAELKRNDHKGGWDESDEDWLLEMAEANISQALMETNSKAIIDAANYLMMAWTKHRPSPQADELVCETCGGSNVIEWKPTKDGGPTSFERIPCPDCATPDAPEPVTTDERLELADHLHGQAMDGDMDDRIRAERDDAPEPPTMEQRAAWWLHFVKENKWQRDAESLAQALSGQDDHLILAWLDAQAEGGEEDE